MRNICTVTTFISAMLTIVVHAQAGNKLYVGNLPFNQGFTFSDVSAQPPIDLVDILLDLSDAHEGSIGSPGMSLPSSFQQIGRAHV